MDVLYDGKFLRMVRSQGWEYVERKKISGIVAILALTDQGRIILVEQYRPPVGRRVLEIPAGLVGDVEGSESEDIAQAAQRELEEETGFRAGHMQALVTGSPSAGLCDEIITLYRATNLTKVGDGGGDEHEDIQVHEVPLDQAQTWLEERRQSGVVIDLKVYAALYFALQRR